MENQDGPVEIRPMPFGGDAENALFLAIECCGMQHDVLEGRTPDEFSGHRFLSESAKTVLITRLVASLKQNGYNIVQTKDNRKD